MALRGHTPGRILSTEDSLKKGATMKAVLTSLAVAAAAASLAGCATEPRPADATPATVAEAQAREAALCKGEAGHELDALAPSNIEKVKPLYAHVHEGKTGSVKRLMGVSLYVHPSMGVTPELLNRRLECHIARELIRGHGADPNDPFAPSGAQPIDVVVSSAGATLKIDIMAGDFDQAKTVVARAKAYAAEPAVMTATQ
jgi:hypothetical protein